MAATVHSKVLATVWLALFLVAALPLRADDSADIHSAIGEVATALSSGDPALAMGPFSKTCSDYDKLSRYFDSLTGAYTLENQIGFSDEDIAASTATVTVTWTMALTTRQDTATRNRNADITVKLIREKKHWKITAVDPITFFDPQT